MTPAILGLIAGGLAASYILARIVGRWLASLDSLDSLGQREPAERDEEVRR
jgi:hypothetical protein